MIIVQVLGKPDDFITFTTNLKWPGIQSSIFPGERPHDRPDITCRVFKLKLDALMTDVLGKVIAHTLTIEWQKRGLTHAHILLIMAKEAKPSCPEYIDQVVRAGIPDKVTNPSLYNVITSMDRVETSTETARVWKETVYNGTVQRTSLNHIA